MIEYPCASVAQGIEHRSPKAGVDGSNPPGGTMKIAGQTVILSGLFLLLEGGRVPICANVCQVRSYASPLCIGDRISKAGIVLRGLARIEFYDEAGSSSIIADVGEGMSFAEAIAAGGIPSVVQVSAVYDTDVLWVDVGRLLSADAVSQSPVAATILVNAVRMLSRKNMLLNKKMQMIAQKRLRDRIKLYLLMQRSAREEGRATFSFNRSDLARYFSSDRSALSRELARMSSEGIIALDDRDIILLKSDFLDR